MNISKNIQWITDAPTQWKLYTNRSYRAKIQTADPQRIYNVPSHLGLVYNYLEDAFEKVGDIGYIVTGIAGEMWPIGTDAVRKYHIAPSQITAEPIPVDTAELDTVYAAIIIPNGKQFSLEVDYGEKAVLHGNRSGIEHGDGDYVLVAARFADGKYQPDFDDNGRVVNGAIFEKLYRLFQP